MIGRSAREIQRLMCGGHQLDQIRFLLGVEKA